MLKDHQVLFRCNIVNIAIALLPVALLSSPSFADDPMNTVDVVAAGITARAELITRDKPVYPRLAQQENREGWVLVDFDIDQNGKAQNTTVLDSVGGHVFELAAVIESLEEIITGNQTLATDGLIRPRGGCVACENR